MKIVINEGYGAFGVSEEAYRYTGRVPEGTWQYDNSIELRTDCKLIEFIEVYGSERAGATYSNLIVKEVPKDILYRVVEYDGIETIEYFDLDDWYLANN